MTWAGRHGLTRDQLVVQALSDLARGRATQGRGRAGASLSPGSRR
eukprot:CAMPEP_0183790406 /NCGR_PEP_ID=MMETSP0803_2-20130417/1041_1 /TAXON_ID=195967 /ORGANISM="Crustomastix stigmata, Strain CCMP3273" /LENGTH=44 /DNA_ID= /DNA_START= /DNA_END= /DNA_ORIENTATION=